MEEGSNPGGSSLTAALNRDALEEVFTHCSPADLLAAAQTCRTAADLLHRSERVWTAKLRESYGLGLKAQAGGDGLFVRLARRVYEASRAQQLRFQGVYVGGGVDEDQMHYFVDNMFRPDKAPYCSNCTRDADCIAMLLDGDVPRDAEFARVRAYMTRRCRYAAALIMNVQMPEHGRDPDEIMHLLNDWTDMQLEGFFKDLANAMQAEHALGRLLVFDIPHERLAAEEEKIRGIHQWLLERPKAMQAGMLKDPSDSNVVFDTSVLPKLVQPGAKRLAGVVHEVALSRVGNLTCPVSAGTVLIGCIDHSRVQGWSAEQVRQLLQSATADPACAALNGMVDPAEVLAASEAGLLPPIAATDQTLAGIWHEFDTSSEAAAQQAAAQQQGAPGDAVQQAAAQRAQSQQQQSIAPTPAAGTEVAAANGAAGPSSSGGAAARQVSTAGIISWRPLLWFKFHSVEEATAFVQRYRPLVEQYGAQATLRHRGSPPTRRGHVTAPAGEAEAQQPHQQQQLGAAADPQWLLGQLQQAVMHPLVLQQQALPAQLALLAAFQAQQQQPEQPGGWLQPQQQAPPAGIPVPLQEQGLVAAAAADVAADVAPAGPPPTIPLPPAMGQPVMAPVALPAGAHVGLFYSEGLAGGAGGEQQPPQQPPQEQQQQQGGQSEDEDEEGDADSQSDDMDDDDTEDSSEGSDVEEQGQAAWLNPWMQDEFGADIQHQQQQQGQVQGQEEDMVVAGEGLLPFDHFGQFDQMDEGDSSEDDEDADLEAEGHFDLEGAGAGGGGGGAAGGAAGGGAPLVQPSAAETLLRALTRRSTRTRNRLVVRLGRPVGGNLALVKLISQENLMDQYGDPHTWPNIDMTEVRFTGKLVELPPGATLTP